MLILAHYLAKEKGGIYQPHPLKSLESGVRKPLTLDFRLWTNKGEGEEKEIDLLHWLLYTGRQGDYGMEQTFEATIEKRDKWYIGWVDAVPGAFSQGRTIKEVEENLKEAVQLILESQRELRDKGTSGETLKRKIQVQV